MFSSSEQLLMKTTPGQWSLAKFPVEIKECFSETHGYLSKKGGPKNMPMTLERILHAELLRFAIQYDWARERFKDNLRGVPIETDKRLSCPQFGMGCATCVHFHSCTSDKCMDYEPLEELQAS